MQLSSQRAANLSRALYGQLCKCEIRKPKLEESEPAFTRDVLAPVVEKLLLDFPGLPLNFRGDGAASQAVPASALEIPFHPDLAISYGAQHVWAAEVKILRRTNRQNSIATAIGQATLYKSRYEHVAVILIDLHPSSRLSQRQLVNQAKKFGITVVIRPALGRVLLDQSSST